MDEASLLGALAVLLVLAGFEVLCAFASEVGLLMGVVGWGVDCDNEPHWEDGVWFTLC